LRYREYGQRKEQPTTRKSKSIKDLAGFLHFEGPPLSLKEVRQGIAASLAADDLRIRRQWRAGVHGPPDPVTNAANALHLRAHENWNTGQLRSAFQLMLSAAKLGDSGAMVNTGYFYDLGIGVKKNRDSAMAWYKRAYRCGNAGGATNVGTIYRDEHKTRRSILWFQKAHAAGDIDANLEIARLYLDQIEDPDRAVPYLERVLAAKPGSEVTRNSREEARLLLKGLKKAPAKRSRPK
jgi:uncharacterized protein